MCCSGKNIKSDRCGSLGIFMVVCEMNIVFIWTGVTSYMADCWRALSRMPGVRLKIYIQEKAQAGTRFNQAEVLEGLDTVLLYENEFLDKDKIRSQIVGFQPTVFFIVGWRARLPRFFALDRSFLSVPKVLIFDLPFAWTLKKLIAPIVLYPYLRRFKVAFVPGRCASQYARWLGFRGSKIKEGLFSLNVSTLSAGVQEVVERRGFLFVARYVRDKRLDILVGAYKKYRKRVEYDAKETCWTLTCCGMGSYEKWIENVDGVENRGFLQPNEIRALYKTHGALVLTSDYETWGMVIAEACASGLPVICTKACGSHIELVKENGFVCETNDVDAIAEAMFQIHTMRNEERITMGMKGLDRVRPYSCEVWTERVAQITSSLAR